MQSTAIFYKFYCLNETQNIFPFILFDTLNPLPLFFPSLTQTSRFSCPRKERKYMQYLLASVQKMPFLVIKEIYCVCRLRPVFFFLLFPFNVSSLHFVTLFPVIHARFKIHSGPYSNPCMKAPVGPQYCCSVRPHFTLQL